MVEPGESARRRRPAGDRRGSRPKAVHAGAGWDANVEELVRDWHNRCAAAQAAHYKMVTRLRRRNVLLGVPAVVFSSLVGTSLFATLTEEEVNAQLRMVIGTVSVAAAILSALQTFLRFSERAERHLIAGDWYAALRRKVAEELALPREERDPPKEFLDNTRKEMSKVGQQSPEIPDGLWTELARRHGVHDPPMVVAGDAAVPPRT